MRISTRPAWTTDGNIHSPRLNNRWEYSLALAEQPMGTSTRPAWTTDENIHSPCLNNRWEYSLAPPEQPMRISTRPAWTTDGNIHSPCLNNWWEYPLALPEQPMGISNPPAKIPLLYRLVSEIKYTSICTSRGEKLKRKKKVLINPQNR